MQGYCEECFAYFVRFRRDDLRTRAQVRFVASGHTSVGWKRFFLNGDLHSIWTTHVQPYLEYYPDADYTQLLSCGELGSEARLACNCRKLILMPLLERTCLDFWTFPDEVRREWYHETIEIILMFMQGKPKRVPRPLPALPFLGLHSYLPLACCDA